MITTQKKMRVCYLGSMTGFNGRDEDLINCMDPHDKFDDSIPNGAEEINNLDLSITHRKIKYHGSEYMIFTDEDKVRLYKILPLITSDETFRWSKRRYAYVAKVNTNSKIRFVISRYSDTNIHISVYLGSKQMYIRAFGDENGIDNKDIKRFIKEVKEELKKEVLAA